MNILLIVSIGAVLMLLCFLFGYIQLRAKSDTVSKYAGIGFVAFGVLFKFYTTVIIMYIIVHFINKYW